MIYVENLVKNYGSKEILRGISFNVEKGGIVGLLGPNGAGKTTTLRILAGYLYPTSGRVEICGIDIQKFPTKAKERIGYLPENAPLYTEMTVREFLTYRAKIKGVIPKKVTERVEEILDTFNLIPVQKKLISQISKGYKQLVGIADTFIHFPDVILLDEPTIGLDPNQIQNVRRIIQNYSTNHSILLSTHILSEIENLCEKIIFLNNGKVKQLENLSILSNKIVVEVKTVDECLINELLDKIIYIKNKIVKKSNNWSLLEIELNTNQYIESICEEVCKLFYEKNILIRKIHYKTSIESLFLT